jgi:hypothetical protein
VPVRPDPAHADAAEPDAVVATLAAHEPGPSALAVRWRPREPWGKP